MIKIISSLFCRHNWEYLCGYRYEGIYTIVYRCSECGKTIKEPPGALDKEQCSHCFVPISVVNNEVTWHCARCSTVIKTPPNKKPHGRNIQLVDIPILTIAFKTVALPGFVRSRNYTTL